MARQIRIKKRKSIAFVVSLLVFGGVVPANASESAPDAGRPFHVELNSMPLYGVKPPTEDAATQTVRLQADHAELFMETWLPATKDGNVPPERVPSILIVTPYDEMSDANTNGVFSPSTLQLFVTRGYAYSQLHVRGTGESTGCHEFLGGQEARDAALAVEYLGREAPWSNGIVGAYGHSYGGGSVLAMATHEADAVRPYLKALIVGAPQASTYSTSWMMDGVASALIVPGGFLFSSVEGPLLNNADPVKWAARKPCSLPHLQNAAQQDNDFSPYYREREVGLYIDQLATPTFMFHGHADLVPVGGAPPNNQVGLFEQIRASTPKVGMFGVFGHELPSALEGDVRAEWERPDFDEMRVAWFDHWLKGIGSGVEGWPIAQVQGTDGQWRGEPDWPFTGGPVGQLALGANNTFGATNPTGDTTYLEVAQETTQGRVPHTYAVFEKTLEARLEITAQPVLDLWVELTRDDAHIAAKLETFDATGKPITAGMTYGMRSAQHLQPLEGNLFVQEKGILAPTGTPINVPIRFQPTDLVVPAGGTIRLTVAGSMIVNPGVNMIGAPDPLVHGWSQGSGTSAPVKILHDCEHPSALRFLMPREDPDLLNVREHDETHVHANPVEAPVSDGGGIATAPVCGEAPVRLSNFGSESDYKAPGGGVVKAPR